MLALAPNNFTLKNGLFSQSADTYESPMTVSVSKEETESELWDYFRNGDDNAFSRIYKKYVNLLFNYGKKFSSDRELIRDCIQDFFLYLREKRSSLGQTTSIKYYLMRSFRRRLFIYLEKADKRGGQSDIYEFEIEFQDCHTQQFINDEAKSYMIERLNKSLHKIGAREREAIYFYYYEGMSYLEIADIMEFSHVSSARRLIYIALNNLKQVLS